MRQQECAGGAAEISRWCSESASGNHRILDKIKPAPAGAMGWSGPCRFHRPSGAGALLWRVRWLRSFLAAPPANFRCPSGTTPGGRPPLCPALPLDAPRGAVRADAGGRGEASGAGLERTYGARAELGLAPRGALAVTLRAGAPAQKTSENRAIRGGHRNNPEHNLRASNHHHNPLSFLPRTAFASSAPLRQKIAAPPAMSLLRRSSPSPSVRAFRL